MHRPPSKIELVVYQKHKYRCAIFKLTSYLPLKVYIRVENFDFLWRKVE